MNLAPIVLFAFNRPQHLVQTLKSLKKNVLANESELFIYIDGPKKENSPEQLANIESVKKIAREEKWCKVVHIIESNVNLGLSASVMKGVTEVVNKYGKIIVLEDDLVSDVYFLKFMNDFLEKYENNFEVISASGYIYPTMKKLPNTFFIKGADCWGWATWKRGWDLMETDGKKLLKEIISKDLSSDFNYFDSYPYLKMLEDQIAGKNNSWAILWYASAFLQNKLTLYPGISLIQNIGIDGSGTHSGISEKYNVNFKGKEINLNKQEVKESKEAKKIIAEYFNELSSIHKVSFFKRITNRLKKK